jgi:hypothetical protein
MERPLDEGIAQEVPVSGSYPAPNVDATPSRLRGSLRASRAFVAATAPKLAARLPITVTVARKSAEVAVVEQAPVVVRPVAGEVVVSQPMPFPRPMPYRVVVPKPPLNILAMLAMPLAVFLPLAGFLAGMVAVRQIRRTGERGALLATLGWIFGLTNTIFAGFVIVMTVLGYAVKLGIEDGVKDSVSAIVMTILNWFFG